MEAVIGWHGLAGWRWASGNIRYLFWWWTSVGQRLVSFSPLLLHLGLGKGKDSCSGKREPDMLLLLTQS
jgi:hypothetical protein